MALSDGDEGYYDYVRYKVFVIRPCYFLLLPMAFFSVILPMADERDLRIEESYYFDNCFKLFDEGRLLFFRVDYIDFCNP